MLTLYPLYLTGRLAEGTFIADGPPKSLDLGLRHFYAPQSFTASDGRRIQFGWAQEARPDAAAVEAGWSGVMSLPRTVALGLDGRLLAAPVDGVADLRVGHGEQVSVAAGDVWATTTGDQLDVSADVHLPAGARVELAVRATDDLGEVTVVRLEREQDGTTRVTLDRSRSRVDSPADDYDLSELGGTLPTPSDDIVTLRVLVDHSMLEVFADGVPLTARVYPSRADAVGVRVRVEGQASANLTIWQMQSTGRR